MSVQIKIVNEKKPDFYHEENYSQSSITIGRDESNSIVLEDKGKSVSRKHAEIRLDEGIYFIVDLGSRNGTYINTCKLTPETPYALEHGSEVSIGDYRIIISMKIIKQKEVDSEIVDHRRDATVFLSNPFFEEAEGFASILDILRKKYEMEDPQIRKEYVLQAFEQTVKSQEDKEIVLLLGSILCATGEREFQYSYPQQTLQGVDQSLEYSKSIGTVVEMFLGILIKMLQFISQFHTEFIGMTRIDTDESLHTKTVNDLKEYFFSPELSAEIFQKRLEQLSYKLDEINVHQVALLNGYRSSIREGVEEILREVNPAIIKNHITKNKITIGPINIPVAFIPLYTEMKTLKELQTKHYELSVEDRGVIERKHFRPAFSKRYLESISHKNK